MLNIQQSCFLRTKIREMQTAILHCQDGAFYNLQSVFVRILELDEEGGLWLAVKKPPIEELLAPDHFDVLLNYYVKGVSFDLDILGEASLCTDQTIVMRLTANAQTEYKNGNLLLRVKIIDIDYWEHTMPIIKRISKKLLQKFSTLPIQNEKIIPLVSDQSFA